MFTVQHDLSVTGAEQNRPDQYFLRPLAPPMCSTVYHPKLAEGHSCNRCKEAEFTLTGFSKANWVCGGGIENYGTHRFCQGA